MRIVSKEYFSEHPKYIKLSAEIGILILALVFLLLPGMLRESELPIGDKPYYHLAKSESFSGIGIGWNFLLNYFPMDALLLAIGLLSVIFIFLNLKMLRLEEKLLALSFFIISPAFIYLFNVGERFGAAFLFSLISSYFFLDKKYFIALISALLVFLFDIWIGFFVLLLFLLYFLFIYNKKKTFYSAIIGCLLLVLLLGDFNNGLISDLGAKIGSSIFALLFVVFCFLFFWSKKKFLSMYAVAVLLLLFSLKTEFGIFYFSLYLSIIMGVCFFEILKIKWESKLIRDLILLIFICGFLFSGLSYANRISKDNPDENIFNALDRLPEGSVVFSDLEYGNWIVYSGKRNVWHSFMNKDEIAAVENDFSRIINSADYFDAAEVLERYEVDYVLIDQRLRERWRDSGLLYLLRYNNENFRLLFEENGVEVWRFFR